MVKPSMNAAVKLSLSLSCLDESNSGISSSAITGMAVGFVVFIVIAIAVAVLVLRARYVISVCYWSSVLSASISSVTVWFWPIVIQSIITNHCIIDDRTIFCHRFDQLKQGLTIS